MPDRPTIVTFEQLPPPARSGPRARAAILNEMAAELRARPGEWAHLDTFETHTGAASKAFNIRRGRLNAFQPEGAYAAESRKVDGRHHVYACYIGEPNPAPVLSEAERKFLTFALDLAFDRMVSDDGFTEDDNAAYDSLRKLAGGEQQ